MSGNIYGVIQHFDYVTYNLPFIKINEGNHILYYFLINIVKKIQFLIKKIIGSLIGDIDIL